MQSRTLLPIQKRKVLVFPSLPTEPKIIGANSLQLDNNHKNYYYYLRLPSSSLLQALRAVYLCLFALEVSFISL